MTGLKRATGDHGKRVFWMIFLAFLMIMIVLVGCSTGNNVSKEKVLDFVWFTDGKEEDVMRSIIADYEKNHPNIKIKLNVVPYDDLEKKIKTMIAGQTPPALARVTEKTSGFFLDYALDLDKYIKDKPEFIDQYKDIIKPYYVYEDKIFAVPMEVTANGLIYNKTLFDQAGVKVPEGSDDIWTWEEFSKSIQQVLNKTDAKYGLLWDATPHRWSTLLYEFGGSMFNEDATKANLNSQEAVNALNYFKKLHDDGIVPKAVWLGGENPNNLFRSGTAAAHLSGSWMMGSYKDINNFEWGVTYLPKEVRRSSVLGIKLVMAFQGSGVEDEAADFAQYLAREDVNNRYVSESLFVTPRKNVKVTYDWGEEYFAIFSNELDNSPWNAAYDWSRSDLTAQFLNDLKANIVEVLQGKRNSKDVLDEVQKKAEEAIKNQ